MLHTGLGRKHFRLDSQVAMIQGHGDAAVVWPMLSCPCLLDDQQHDPNCAACHGKGRLYPQDAMFVTTILMIEEQSQQTYNDPGLWVPGTIQMSILPGVYLGTRDKVRRIDITEIFNQETLERGGDETLRMSGNVRLLLVADRDR